MLCLLLFLVACQSSEIFTFEGESDNWSAKLKVYREKDFEEQQFELRYLGDDIKSVGEFSYHVETNAGSSSQSDIELPENGVITDTSTSRDAAKVSENAEVEVTITWGNNTESILLK